MDTYIRLIVRQRWPVLVAIAAITAAALVVISRASIVSTIGGLFLGESPAYQAYVERTRRFGNDELLVVAVEDLDLGDPEERAKLARVVDGLRALPELGQVTSALDATRLEDGPDGLRAISFAAAAGELAGESARALLQRYCESPGVKGLLFSSDCRHAAVIVEMRRDEQRSVERYPQLVDEVLGHFEAAGIAPERLQRAGWIAVLGETMDQTWFNLSRMMPLVGLVLLVTMLLLFRRLWPVLITGAVALIGVIWSLGFGVLLFERIDVFMAMCPIFILIIACADVIHLCGAYLTELSRGADKARAIALAGSEVGQACLYTSMTTFAGFVSMTLVPAPVFRQSGLILGFGVAVSLLLALTLSPILFSLLPTPAVDGKGSPALGWIDGLLKKLSAVARDRPWAVVAAFGLLVALAIAGTLQIRVETDFSRRLGVDNPIRVGQRFFRQHFAGVGSLEIFVEAPADGGLLDPALFEKLARYQDRLQELPGVDRALSSVDLLREAHRALGGEGALPGSREAMAQTLLLLEMDASEQLARLIDAEKRGMRMHLRLRDEGVLATHDVGEQARALAAEIVGPAAQVEISGLTYLLGAWLDTLVTGQRNALLLALVTILVMMIVALRSLRAGLWSMVPNTLPLLALLGYVGWAWDTVDSDTYIVCLVAIGIGVDDTIHFLMRFRRERQRCADVDSAIEAAFAYAGRAIVITSVILVAGFAPLALSDYFATRMFGTLLPGSLVVALAAVLLLVPALIKLGAIRFPGGGRA